MKVWREGCTSGAIWRCRSTCRAQSFIYSLFIVSSRCSGGRGGVIYLLWLLCIIYHSLDSLCTNFTNIDHFFYTRTTDTLHRSLYPLYQYILLTFFTSSSTSLCIGGLVHVAVPSSCHSNVHPALAQVGHQEHLRAEPALRRILLVDWVNT